MTQQANFNRNKGLFADKIRGLETSIRRKLPVLVLTVCWLAAPEVCAQTIAVKSNLLYDLTTSLNIGGEIRCDDTHTFNLSVTYNPFTFRDNRKMKLFLIQPEYRKWLNEAFMGSYIGLQVHYAWYNFGGMLPWGFKNGEMLGIQNRQIANNRYQGNLAGFGVSYGYQWMISPQWNLEAGISLGYAHLNYKRYGQPEGAPLIEKSHCNYWGVTQLGISVVYFIP